MQFKVPRLAGGHGRFHRSQNNRARAWGVKVDRLRHIRFEVHRQAENPASLLGPDQGIVHKIKVPAAHARHLAGFGQQAFAFAQRLFLPLLRRNVDLNAEHPLRLAIGGVGRDVAAIKQPDPMPLRMHLAQFHLEPANRVSKIAPQRLDHAGPVIGMLLRD